MTIYANQSLWIGAGPCCCPSRDTVGLGTTTLTDFTGVNNWTLTNMDAASDWVDDGGYCLDFDGSNDHCVTNAKSAVPHTLEKLTVSYWFKRTATSTIGPVMQFNTALSAQNAYVAPWRDGQIYLLAAANNFGYFASNDTNWHHILYQFDGTASGNSGRLRCWLDGVEKTLTFFGTIPQTTITASNSPTRIYIGAMHNGESINYGSGRFDDLRVLYRNATSDEKTALFSGRGAAFATAASGGVRAVNIRGGADQ